jgi:hypothetical protein
MCWTLFPLPSNTEWAKSRYRVIKYKKSTYFWPTLYIPFTFFRETLYILFFFSNKIIFQMVTVITKTNIQTKLLNNYNLKSLSCEANAITVSLEILEIYVIQNFIWVFRTARHFFLSRAKLIPFTPSYSIYVRTIQYYLLIYASDFEVAFLH